MTRSMVSPDTIWLRKTELTDSGLFLVLRVRSNIKEVSIEDEKGSHIEYEYDETETRYQAPDTLLSVADIKTLLSVEVANITKKASKEKAWKEIHAKPIEELRTVSAIKTTV